MDEDSQYGDRYCEEQGCEQPQWFHSYDYHTRLPEEVSAECKRFYGSGDVGAEFAQSLASFMQAHQPRRILAAALVDASRVDEA